MKLTEIANLLNTKIVPNLLGENTTIAADLSNIIDLGIKLADMDADSLKDYMQAFAVGVVDNWMDTRSYSRQTYGLFISSIEYGGALQRTKAKLMKAYDTPILSLENYNSNPSAPDYTDGRYYGAEFDSDLITKDVAFQMPYSIPVEMFKKSFTDASGVRSLVALVEAAADRTLTNEINGLAKTLIAKLAMSCKGAREVKLFTLYNSLMGFGAQDEGHVTLTNWKNDTNFKLWCEALVIQLKKRVTEYNNVCNDGSIETFTPEEDINVCLLSEFAVALDFAQSSVYHRELTDIGNYYTTEYWMNSSNDIIPQIKSNSVHDEIVETVEGSTKKLQHVVGLIYDRQAVGICQKLNKVTSAYIPAGDFTTLFHHVVNSYWIDGRNTAIVLTLA